MVYNDTQDIDDPFANVEHTSSDYNTAIRYVLITEDIIIIVLCLCALITDILIIYLISRFKRLKTTINSYIMHYAILNISYFLGIPIIALIHWILTSMHANFYTEEQIECLVMETDRVCMFLCFLFAFALSFDWYIMVFKPELGLKINVVYKYLIIILYILGCIKFIVQNSLCFTIFFDLGPTILSITYCIILLFTLVLDYLNFRYKVSIRNVKTSYSLTISNVILLSWLPMFTYNFLHQILVYEHTTFFMLYLFHIIPEAIGFSASIFVLIALYKKNKYVIMALGKLFKRSVRYYSNEEDDLDESDVNNSDINPSVAYKNSTTSINI